MKVFSPTQLDTDWPKIEECLAAMIILTCCNNPSQIEITWITSPSTGILDNVASRASLKTILLLGRFLWCINIKPLYKFKEWDRTLQQW